MVSGNSIARNLCPCPAAPRAAFDSPHASVSLQDAARENHPPCAVECWSVAFHDRALYYARGQFYPFFTHRNKSTKFITILLTFLSIWLLKSIEFKTQAAKA